MLDTYTKHWTFGPCGTKLAHLLARMLSLKKRQWQNSSTICHWMIQRMSGVIRFMFTENWMQLLMAEGKGYVQANITLITRLLTYIMENPYEVEKVSKLNETTIYLGLFIKQWGHFLVDFVPRLWYLINNDSDLRLVYVSVGNQEINGVFAEFLSVFGIDTKRLTCIKNPTEFTKLIIPQTSYERPYRYYTEYKSIFDYMHSKIDELNLSYQRYEKIYWTRTRLKKARKTETGEKVIEKLFEANGYKVLSPEKLLIRSPLSIWGQPPAKWKSAASAPTRAK